MGRLSTTECTYLPTYLIPWRRAGRPSGETPPPLQPSASTRACVVLASCLRHACNEGTTTRAPPPLPTHLRPAWVRTQGRSGDDG